MSEYKKESTRMKARYLGQAYQIALDSMPSKTWNDCCQEAINQLAAVHIRYIKNARVLERWNVEFRQRKTFTVKNRGKRDLPAFLEAHPIVVTVMKEYGRENLSELSVEMMHQQSECDCFRSEPEHTFSPITRSDKNNSPRRQRPIWTALPLQ